MLMSKVELFYEQIMHVLVLNTKSLLLELQAKVAVMLSDVGKSFA
jgi:hypothetical protein